jgi:AraC family transcriptional regulator, positive regulator of tynA and feaB
MVMRKDERVTVAVDVTAPAAADRSVELLRDGWEAQTGGAYPLPPFRPVRPGGHRISVQASTLLDMLVDGVYSESLVGTHGGGAEQSDDLVMMHIVQRGTWSFSEPDGGPATRLAAGEFSLRQSRRPAFEIARRSAARMLILPASRLRPLVGDLPIVGSATSVEMRVLLAHAAAVEGVLDELTPAGAQAAHEALLELIKGVVRQEFDDVEPKLTTALHRAAGLLADSRLTDPDLSPAMLARELHVSVRTLHRAFAAAQDSVSEHIRRGRLERAREDLSTPAARPSVAEVAARWQFADSSHFIRAFKKQYGETPSRFARSHDRP